MSLEQQIEALTVQLTRIADHLTGTAAKPVSNSEAKRLAVLEKGAAEEATPSKPNVGKDVKAAQEEAAENSTEETEVDGVEDQTPVEFKVLHALFHRTLVQIKQHKGLPAAKIVCKKFLTKFTKGGVPLTEGALPVEKYNDAYQEVLNVRSQHDITED